MSQTVLSEIQDFGSQGSPLCNGPGGVREVETEQSKSPTLQTPWLVTRMLAGLMSTRRTPLLWQWARAEATCSAARGNQLEPRVFSLPRAFSLYSTISLCRFLLPTYSMMITAYLLSAACKPYTCTMFSWSSFLACSSLSRVFLLLVLLPPALSPSSPYGGPAPQCPRHL